MDPAAEPGTRTTSHIAGGRPGSRVAGSCLKEAPGGEAPGPAPRHFATTRWSVVVAAGGAGSAARAALGTLCGGAWYPLYAFARRGGLGHDDAADAVQSFFATFLEKGWAADADSGRGRFRAFLKVAFRRHLTKLRDRAGTRKRGGSRHFLTLTPPDAAARYAREPSHDRTPEVLFERRWALGLLGRALDALAAEHAGDPDRARRFEALRPRLTGAGGTPYAELAAEWGTSEAAVKASAARLRARFAELLRAAVADTVASPAQIADELNALKAALAG